MTGLFRRSFDELSARELYEILRARIDVFVVEQKCPYPEIDGRDPQAVHLYIEEDGRLRAYLRYFPVDKEESVWQIGRVLTTRRKKGYGGRLLHKAVRQIQSIETAGKIVLEAQVQAVGFYEREGFVRQGEVFLEDGIPHVRMELSLRPDPPVEAENRS